MSEHAILSPSGADRWMICHGSVRMENGREDSGSIYAREGQATHALAALLLTSPLTDQSFIHSARDFIGMQIETDGEIITEDMADAVDTYVEYIRHLVEITGGEMFVEQRMSIESLTGEPDAYGTADVIILTKHELIVVDLKNGQRHVEVVANRQLRIYALAALGKFGLLQDFDTVRLVVFMPKHGGASEWVVTMPELWAFGREVSETAVATRDPMAPLVPGETQCRYCKAKVDCEALQATLNTAGCFDNLDDLAALPRAEATLAQKAEVVPLARMWCDAVMEEVNAKVLRGEQVTGFKAVRGRQGDRKWRDEARTAALFKSMRLPHDQMYTYKLISPVGVEKLQKSGRIGPKQWATLASEIVRAPGAITVVPVSDKRPAVEIRDSDFEDLAERDEESGICS